MNLALTVLEIVAPVFVLGGIGFAWVRLGFDFRLEFVTRLVMVLAMPSLVFTALMQAEVAPAALSRIALATLASYAALGLVFAVMLAALRLDRRSYLSPLIFGNTGNLGLPISLFAYGNEGLALGVAVFAVSAVVVFTAGAWLVAGGGSPVRMLREPLIGAVALGALFLWQGWTTPVFVTNTLTLLGQLAIPLMLLTLGVAVARLDARRLTRAVWLSLVRVVICVAVASAIARLLQLGPVPSAILILQISTPVAVTSYLLAERYRADSQAVAELVLVSTLISVISLPLTLAFVI